MDRLASSIDWIGTNVRFVQDLFPLMPALRSWLRIRIHLGHVLEAVISAITGCRASVSVT
jgi:hypothetical protein